MNGLTKCAIASHYLCVWIERNVAKTLRHSVKTRPVTVLTGARQTGKTALLRHLFPEYSFVSLDLPSEAELAEKEPELFLARHPRPLIVDEVQYAPALFRHLKAVVDAERNRYGQFLLTGSQKFALMHNVAESLAGRADVLELEALSWQEIRTALPETTLTEAMFRGGFPELWANPEIDSVSFYNSYIASYLERDVRQLLQVGSLRDFERFLRACAIRSGNMLNKADLARDVGIAPSTANQWLSALEASGQVVLLEPWFSNRTKSMTKSPKLYLADSGMLCALLNLRTVESMMNAANIGAIWETYVFAQLRNRERQAGHRGSLFYWRDRSREVDFLVDHGSEVELLEAKWTEIPDRRDTASLEHVAKAVGMGDRLKGAVVCRTQTPFPFGNGFRAIGIEEVVGSSQPAA